MGVVAESKAGEDYDWELHAWSEVPLERYQELSGRLKEMESEKKKEHERKPEGGIVEWLMGARRREELKEAKDVPRIF